MTNTITPTVAITNQETINVYGGAQINGIGQPGSTISLVDNGNPLAGLTAITVAADGTWKSIEPIGNLAVGTNNIIAHDKGSSGLDGTSDTLSLKFVTTPLNVTAPFVQIDPSATMLNSTTAELSGLVFDFDALKSVDVLSDGNLIGAATVKADNTWSFSFDQGAGDFADLTLEATDVLGNVSHVNAAFELITGIQDSPFASEQITTSLDGNTTNSAFFAGNGSLLYSSTTTFDVAGLASAVITGAGNSIHYDIASGDKFDEIVNFHAKGTSHDSLSLAGSDIHNAAQLFSHSTTVGGNTTIKLTADTSITLDGVGRADLHAHKADFTFA